jgi:hypothetical protein
VLVSLLFSFAFAQQCQKEIKDTCVNSTKIYEIADEGSKFQKIIFRGGNIRILSQSPNESLTLECNSLRSTNKSKSWTVKQESQTGLLPFLLGEESISTITNSNEKVIQSKVVIHQGSYAELTDSSWGAEVSVRLRCSKTAHDTGLQIYKHGKLISSVQSTKADENQDPKTPQLNCTSKNFEINLAKDCITLTSSGSPTAVSPSHSDSGVQ